MKLALILAVLLLQGKASAQVPMKHLIANVPMHDVQVQAGNIIAYAYGTGQLFMLRGNHFIQHQLDSGYYEQLQFVNTTGYLVGERSTIYKTTDGGSTWNPLRTLPYPDVFLYALHFTNVNEGIVSGFRIESINEKRIFTPHHFITHDGGITWQGLPEWSKFLIIRYYKTPNHTLLGNGNNVLIVADYAGRKQHVLYYDSLKKTGDIRASHFLDESLGVAASFTGHVLITRDGGASWKKIGLPSFSLRDILLLDPDIILVVGNFSNGKNASISIDAGETWKDLALTSADIHRMARHEDKLLLAGKSGLIEVSIKNLLENSN